MIKNIKYLFSSKVVLALSISAFFFSGLMLTISHYNIMWDGRNHFFRGQAFANFFLFGRHNYNDLPITAEYARYYRDYMSKFSYIDIERRISKNPDFRRSIYQGETHTFDWLMKQKPTGHPVLSDIGSAFFNILFYEKLGWARDDHAYHLYSIVLASILVGVIFYWMSTTYGLFAAIVSTITLTSMPLFWAESHYNIKDIPLMVFFSLAFWSFYKGLVKFSLKWVIFSSVMAGLALGTKFNALFTPLIIFFWGGIYVFMKNNLSRKKYLNWWWIVVAYPLIMFLILVVGWPQLWNDPIGGFLSVMSYYREVGSNVDYTPTFRTLFGLSTYASYWILVTTYPLVTVLAIAGIITWLLRFRKTKDTLPLLFILWVFVPIIRASLPNTSIFGGVRHIIEYITPLSLLAGYGAKNIVEWIHGYMVILLKKPFSHLIIQLFIIFIFVPFVIILIRLHPAENVYFNSFTGGLPGAKNANLTGWGNTDGGIYEKAVEWINKNSEKNSHLAVGFSELADFYLPEFRNDLLADNRFSGYLQKGEYIIALTHNSELENTYRMLYPETVFIPLYEYKVDGVPLIKIWKNDKKYVKAEFSSLIENSLIINPKRMNDGLYWDIGSIKRVARIELLFNNDGFCKDLSLGYLRMSKDGSNWEQLPETYPGVPIEALGSQPNGDRIIIPIANLFARYLLLVIEPSNACMFTIKQSKIITLE